MVNTRAWISTRILRIDFRFNSRRAGDIEDMHPLGKRNGEQVRL